MDRKSFTFDFALSFELYPRYWTIDYWFEISNIKRFMTFGLVLGPITFTLDLYRSITKMMPK
jgi:hypothetical protein